MKSHARHSLLFLREGVSDLEEEQPGRDQSNCIGLNNITIRFISKTFLIELAHPPDPALLQMILQWEVPEHGSHRVGVSQLGHPRLRPALKYLVTQ